jgi:hypothetical protein
MNLQQQQQQQHLFYVYKTFTVFYHTQQKDNCKTPVA